MVLSVDIPKDSKTNRALPFHSWTEAENDIIRRDYRGSYQSAHLIAQRLSFMTREDITWNSVRNQAARLGICRFRRDWMPEENERLPNLIACFPLKVVAKMMHRSKFSIRAHATRLGMSTRVRDGWFTHKEACNILGVDHRALQLWIDTGKLRANKHSNTIPRKGGHTIWHIASRDLTDFIKSFASELGRNADIFMIVELLKGGVL